MSDDLLADILIGNIVTDQADPFEAAKMPAAQSLRRMAKRRYQNMLKEERLHEVLRDPPATGESVHIVSNSACDFWHWVPTMGQWLGQIDALYCSTWTLSRPNALDMFALHDDGGIAKGQIHFLTGLYFKRRETAVYNLLLQGIVERKGRYKAFENHAKVLLIHNARKKVFLTVEGSANLTANPRFEQYVLTNDRELHAFHRAWMDQVFATPGRTRKTVSRSAHAADRLGYSCRRAGLGVLAARNDPHSRKALICWKLATTPDLAKADVYAEELLALIKQWSPTLPPTTCVTVPPQGASWPGKYFAELIGRAVARRLECPFQVLLKRTDEKHYHHPHAALAQAPFKTNKTKATTAIVIDDLITSGTTMRLSLEALRKSGMTAFGFAYNGS